MTPISGIYIIEHLPTGKAYVGQTTDFQARMGQHRLTASKMRGEPSPFRAIVDVEGWDNFVCAVVEECPPDKLRERERYWISLFEPHELLNLQTYRVPKRGIKGLTRNGLLC